MAFNSMAEYQADIKLRYPAGVPFVTPYEQFCRVHYNFDVIARDYGLQQDNNARPIRKAAPRVLPAIPKHVIIPIQTKKETIKGVDL